MLTGFTKILPLIFLAGCASSPCEQRAWEAAGNAMSNVQYNLENQLEWDRQVNCNTTLCMNTPNLDVINTGLASGPNSDTLYKGLGPREVFDKSMKECK